MADPFGQPLGDYDDQAAVALNTSLHLYFKPNSMMLILHFLRRRLQGTFNQFPPFVRCYFRDMGNRDFFRLPHYHLPATYNFCRLSPYTTRAPVGWASISGPKFLFFNNFGPAATPFGVFHTFVQMSSGVIVTEYIFLLQEAHAGPRLDIALYEINSPPHF